MGMFQARSQRAYYCHEQIPNVARLLISAHLTKWSRVILENLPFAGLVTKFFAFYGHEKFITKFNRALYLTMHWAGCTHSTNSHPISFKIYSNITLPYTTISSERSLSLRIFHQNFVCVSHLHYACYMPRPSQPISFNHRNNVWSEGYRCNFLQLSSTSSLSSAPCSQIHLTCVPFFFLLLG